MGNSPKTHAFLIYVHAYSSVREYENTCATLGATDDPVWKLAWIGVMSSTIMYKIKHCFR